MASKEENPDIQWAMDLLTPGPDYELNFFSKYLPYMLFGSVSQIGVVLYNKYAGRPHLSGIQRYPITFIIGMGIAHVLKIQKEHREGMRDAILKDYIRKFPEDFKEPTKRTFNDVFHPWSPWR